MKPSTLAWVSMCLMSLAGLAYLVCGQVSYGVGQYEVRARFDRPLPAGMKVGYQVVSAAQVPVFMQHDPHPEFWPQPVPEPLDHPFEIVVRFSSTTGSRMAADRVQPQGDCVLFVFESNAGQRFLQPVSLPAWSTNDELLVPVPGLPSADRTAE